MRRLKLLVVGSGVVIAACSPGGTTEASRNEAVASQTVASPVSAASPATELAGRWTGVEGMYLVVKPAAAGAYALEMQYDLDHKQTATGRATADGIAFERDGRTLTLKPTDGAATGLKYLADKRDCLTVAPGEGYCRG